MSAVRGRLGAILTTGVVLSAAAAVVANPVIAPRGDLRVPAIELSAGYGDDDLAMLDSQFLDAIAPSSTELSSSPLSVLNDLVTSLAADVSYLGRHALIAIFSSGVAAVVDTNLTAVTSPYPATMDNVLGAAPLGPVTAAPPTPAGLAEPLSTPSSDRLDPVVSAVVPSRVAGVLEQSLQAVVDDAARAGGRAWTDAITEVDALLQAGDRVVVDSLRRLVDPAGSSVLVIPNFATQPNVTAVPSVSVPLRMPTLPSPEVQRPVAAGVSLSETAAAVTAAGMRRQSSAALDAAREGTTRAARDALRRATSRAAGMDGD